MAVNSVAMKSGDTVWKLVANAKPGATRDDVEKVLTANNLTWDSATTLRVGTEIDLSAVLPQESQAAEPVSTAVSSVSENGIASATSVDEIYNRLITQQQQATRMSTGNFLLGTGADATNLNGLASRSANYAYYASGQHLLDSRSSLSSILGGSGYYGLSPLSGSNVLFSDFNSLYSMGLTDPNAFYGTLDPTFGGLYYLA